MSWQLTLALYGLIMLGCLGGGVAIGSAIGIVGIVGITLSSGTSVWLSFGDVVWNATNTFTLVSIPLFVLMGEIILRSGISQRFYSGSAKLLAFLPGGLLQTNIVGCAIFSAIAGSTVATALTVGTVAIPELDKRGYSDKLTLGSLAAGGCLGILIPPSIPLIVYGSMVQVSIIDLFMAGLVPGLVLALLFMLYLTVRALLSPQLAPRSTEKITPAELGKAFLDTVPVILLVAAVIGGMYKGVVTPTEAAALGVSLAFVLALVYRQISLSMLWSALRNAVFTSTVMMFIVVNAQILNFAITTSGVGAGLAAALAGSGMPPFLFFTMLFLIYLVLGMFVDGLSIMLLTVPLLYPSFASMGFDPIWVGVIIVIFIELGALTPPMGLNLFAIQSIAPEGTSLGKVARSSAPFALIIAIFVYVLYYLPQIALWLPLSLKGGL